MKTHYLSHEAAEVARPNAIAQRLTSIEQKGAMTGAEVADILEIRRETVSRWFTGKTIPQRDSERLLLDLEFVVDKLSDVFDPQEARLWVLSRQKLLADRRPADMIREGRVDEVIAVINRLTEGTYT
jgi:uncharacterized protein (DUF2384 family)